MEGLREEGKYFVVGEREGETIAKEREQEKKGVREGERRGGYIYGASAFVSHFKRLTREVWRKDLASELAAVVSPSVCLCVVVVAEAESNTKW